MMGKSILKEEWYLRRVPGTDVYRLTTIDGTAILFETKKSAELILELKRHSEAVEAAFINTLTQIGFLRPIEFAANLISECRAEAKRPPEIIPDQIFKKDKHRNLHRYYKVFCAGCGASEYGPRNGSAHTSYQYFIQRIHWTQDDEGYFYCPLCSVKQMKEADQMELSHD